jgi:two-component system osmolarity sensor histidine kinase EnvZ
MASSPTPAADSQYPNQQPATELLTSALDDLDEEPGDSLFEEERSARKRWRISLFWYTFGLLLILLAGSMLAGYLLLRTLDVKPRMIENTRQIVSIVVLTRTALLEPETDEHVQEVATLMPPQRMHLVPHQAIDRAQPFPESDEVRYLSDALHQRLGTQVELAHSVNGKPGLWVGFSTRKGNWWLWFDDVRINQGISGNVWLLWAAIILLPMLAGAALLARLINRPLDALAGATMQVREGDYSNSRLDESVPQAEVYEVNKRFNRMAEQLARVDQDRAQMLAGISHDLRTPLARLRLEIEMGVSDEQARERMASDIQQVSTVLNKFLDYARPSRVELNPVDLYRVARRCARLFARRENMSVQVDVPRRTYVRADEVELERIFVNLLENASSYGQTPGTGFTRVRIAATVKNGWVKLRVRDYGPGVPEEQLQQLTRPFYRGDAARRNAAGTGLGLAIAARTVEAMSGQFRIINANSGGLQALIRLPLTRAPHLTHAG